MPSQVSVYLKNKCDGIEARVFYDHMASIRITGPVIHPIEQDFHEISNRTNYTCLLLSDDRYVEDAVSKLFGLCHRRWMTTPPLLILRFNSRDTFSFSSVKAIQDLQLSSIPCMLIPDRPLGAIHGASIG